uniref:Uncharacterized protein n=1 Tax=Romanomermis culicivorax TaxID=13658 RepID=A0A915KQT7_ROMCU
MDPTNDESARAVAAISPVSVVESDYASSSSTSTPSAATIDNRRSVNVLPNLAEKVNKKYKQKDKKDTENGRHKEKYKVMKQNKKKKVKRTEEKQFGIKMIGANLAAEMIESKMSGAETESA